MLTAVQRIAVEGHVKNSLVDLESDTQGNKRTALELASGIAYVLASDRFPLPAETDQEFKQELKDDLEALVEFYNNPLSMLIFFKKTTTFVETDSVILGYIQSITRQVLLNALKEHQPTHALITQVEINPEPSVSAPPISQDEAVPQAVVNVIGNGMIQSNNYPVPVLIFQFPKNSLGAAITFQRLYHIFKKFNLQSYKIFDQEYAQIDAVRGEFDNIIIYAIPSLTRAMFLTLINAVVGLENNLKSYSLDSVEHFYHTQYVPDIGTDTHALQHFLNLAEAKSRNQSSYYNADCYVMCYYYMRAINILCMKEVSKWDEYDFAYAKKIIQEIDCDIKISKMLILAPAELENSMGLYCERRGDFAKACDYYLGAATRLKYTKPPQPGLRISNIMLGGGESETPSHSATQALGARTLSTLCLIQDNYIRMLGKCRDDSFTINEATKELKEMLAKLRKLEPSKELKISSLLPQQPLHAQPGKPDTVLATVKPLAPLPKYGVFTTQVAANLDFDITDFEKLTRIYTCAIRHVKPGYVLSNNVVSIEIIAVNLVQAQVVEQVVRQLLEEKNNRKYGGLIALDAKESVVNISFDAWNDLKQAMQECRHTPLKYYHS